tara:strand:- start:77 stop:1057 length:981 start_codon:yes stop_codon:yes gene_type:complete
MNDLINKISKPIESDLVKFNDFFKVNLSSDVKIINSVINYMIKTKGKQYRTILCLLCSRLTNEEPNDLSFLSASSVEALHIATLLHDDVVDDSDIRRGWPTINKIWKNKLSILIGDYLFSKVLINISKFNDLHSIGILSDISKRLSEGEIFQIEKAINKEMSEQEYLKMISDKTASLISSACYLGFYSNNKDQEAGRKIQNFGEYLGLAYQIKDDVFDIIGNINDTGKKSNLDVKKNMLTLPYIHSISNLNNKDKKSFLLKIRKYASKKDVNGIKNMIINSGGIKYAMDKINYFSKMAIHELDDFPSSEYKSSLINAVEFNIERKY